MPHFLKHFIILSLSDSAMRCIGSTEFRSNLLSSGYDYWRRNSLWIKKTCWTHINSLEQNMDIKSEEMHKRFSILQNDLQWYEEIF